MKVQDADLTEKLVRRHIFKGKDIVLREVQAGLLDA
jgi:hypothetical protein